MKKIIYLLFFLSGFCGLVYEVIWEHRLELIFGVSAYAVATVIASYMAGLSIGSVLFGKLVDKKRDPLAVYGLLEICIGVYALMMPYLLSGLNQGYAVLFGGSDAGGFGHLALLFVLCLAVMIVPTAFMGGTLPVISKFMVERMPDFGREFGRLYGINILGGVAGCFIAGFFLIRFLGLNSANHAAAFMNILIGALEYWL